MNAFKTERVKSSVGNNSLCVLTVNPVRMSFQSETIKAVDAYENSPSANNIIRPLEETSNFHHIESG